MPEGREDIACAVQDDTIIVAGELQLCCQMV